MKSSTFPISNERLDVLSNSAQNYLSFECSEKSTNWWCDGCGNFSILNALKRALAIKQIKQNEVVFCYDVGCNGNESDKIEANTIHGLHGRVLPLAAGVKIANPRLKVIASAGDGATFSEGVNHLVHAVRNNYPVLFIHHDNKNYALTTGQASSLTPKGYIRNAAPMGTAQEPINSLSFVLSLNPTFVARSISADINHMTEVFLKALEHSGFAFVEILQSCPTYCRETKNEWYLAHTQDVSELENYQASDIWAARRIVEEYEKVPVGVIYQNAQKENYLETLSYRKNVSTTPVEEVAHADISEFLKEL